jgi:hypothetical protein
MRRLALVLALLATSATAQTNPPYTDNRSTAADVVTSLYNAINRHEYLRAHSYFRPGAVPDFKPFAAGYAKTTFVEIKLGPVTNEGAAGTIHTQVPIALRATTQDGRKTVFVGCYSLSQVEPALQETAPFRPITIDEGHLQKTSKPFAAASGRCD